MLTFLTVIAALILIALIYLSTLSGDYEVRVTRTLPAAQDELYHRLIDFKTWHQWSPWIMHEPDCPLEYSDNVTEVGGHYSWDGKLIGAGSMEHTLLEYPSRTEEKLTCTRPFKSVCKVGFELEAEGEQTQGPKTKVTWYMKGSMPFLFRTMVRRTREMIQTDYETGLAMLSGVLDPNSEHPKFEFLGNQSRETTTYLSIPWEGSIEDMPAAMAKGFAELGEYFASGSAVAAGQPISVYHKVKNRGTYFVMDMGIPVSEGTEDNKYQVKQIEGGTFQQTQLTGSYDFLKSAWHNAMGHMKMTKTKFDWKRPCVELYENDHSTVDHTNELVTSIFVPVK